MKRLDSPLGVVAIVFAGLAALWGVLLAKPLGLGLPDPLRAALWWLIPLGGAWLVAGREALKELGLTHFERRGVAVALAGAGMRGSTRGGIVPCGCPSLHTRP